MSTNLFRSRAVRHRTRREFGDVFIVRPVSLKLLTALILAIVAGTAIFLASADYARRERVQGFLRPSGGVVTLVAPEASTVDRLPVGEGSAVAVGASLIRLTPMVSTTLGGGLETLLIDEIGRQNTIIERRMEASETRAKLERRRLSKRIALLADARHTLEIRLQSQRERTKLLHEAVDDSRTLYEKGLLARTLMRRALSDLLLSKQEEERFLAELVRNRGEREEAEVALQEVDPDLREERSRLETERSILVQREAEITKRRSVELEASIDGRVTSLQVSEGQTVAAGTMLMSVLPFDAPLEARLMLPSRAIGLIRQGQRVKLFYRAFPHQRFGAFDGKIREVSRTIVAPKDLPAPFEVAEPVYLATVTIEAQTVTAFGTAVPLQAGMLLDADVILEERPLLDWLIDPVSRLGAG